MKGCIILYLPQGFEIPNYLQKYTVYRNSYRTVTVNQNSYWPVTIPDFTFGCNTFPITARRKRRSCTIIAYKDSMDVPGGSSMYPSKNFRRWAILSWKHVRNFNSGSSSASVTDTQHKILSSFVVHCYSQLRNHPFTTMDVDDNQPGEWQSP